MKFEHTVIGSDDEGKEKVRTIINKKYEGKTDHSLEYEIEKTEKEQELIECSKELAKTVLSNHGVNIQDIQERPEPRVVVVQNGDVEFMTAGKIYGGMAKSELNRIVVERKDSEINFVINAAHEYLHIYKDSVYRIIKDQPNVSVLETHRIGLKLLSREDQTVYFDKLEESLVTKLTDHVFDELSKDDLYADEIKESDANKRYISDFFLKVIPESYPNERKVLSEYHLQEVMYVDPVFFDKSFFDQAAARIVDSTIDQRKKIVAEAIKHIDDACRKGIVLMKHRSPLVKELDGLCNEVQVALPDVYSSPEEVFNALVRANYSGDIKQIISLSKSIRDAIGKEKYLEYVKQFSTSDETLPKTL